MKKTTKTSKLLLVKNNSINKKLLISETQKKLPDIASVLDNCYGFLSDKLNLNVEDKIICGVSGGVDSVTLLDVLVNFSFKQGFKLIVAHFNHRLRGVASNDDELFVKELAEKYKLTFHQAIDNVKHHAEIHHLSIEEAARKLRYRFFERVAKAENANFIATAHTADDSAETILINLMRGSGLTGLGGIQKQRIFARKYIMIRPFIELNKTELINFAKARNLQWREDESNSLLFYTRNKVRHDLIPKLQNDYSPAIIDVLNRTGKLISGADKFISNYIEEQLINLIIDRRQQRFSIKISNLLTYDEFMQGELLQASLGMVLKSMPLPMQTIDRIIKLIDSPTGSICEINKKLIALKDRDELVFSKVVEHFKIDMTINNIGEYSIGQKRFILKEINKEEMKYSNDPNIEYFDLDLIPKRLKIRLWQQGDSFQPLGFEGTVKISDFLTNKKINLLDKQSVLVLTTSTDIIWLCGIRASDKFKITNETNRFLKVEYI